MLTYRGTFGSILLREDPDAVEAMILRALVLFLRAQLSDAVTQIVAVLKLDPDNERGKELRTRVKNVARLKDDGNDAFGKGDWSEAKQAWSNALQVSDLPFSHANVTGPNAIQIIEERAEEGCGGIVRATLLLNRATVHQKVGGLRTPEHLISQSAPLVTVHLSSARSRKDSRTSTSH